MSVKDWWLVGLDLWCVNDHERRMNNCHRDVAIGDGHLEFTVYGGARNYTARIENITLPP